MVPELHSVKAPDVYKLFKEVVGTGNYPAWQFDQIFIKHEVEGGTLWYLERGSHTGNLDTVSLEFFQTDELFSAWKFSFDNRSFEMGSPEKPALIFSSFGTSPTVANEFANPALDEIWKKRVLEYKFNQENMVAELEASIEHFSEKTEEAKSDLEYYLSHMGERPRRGFRKAPKRACKAKDV